MRISGCAAVTSSAAARAAVGHAVVERVEEEVRESIAADHARDHHRELRQAEMAQLVPDLLRGAICFQVSGCASCLFAFTGTKQLLQ